ncbi:hypothetical protein [uncultured Aquimarina sp.]|uniref:hypothetical protein n=1 Tax=uncultured Aquimarina sp. TaxID=575652 RepID=UPI002611E0E5|nr:hypothetical protein [uncultured Aquimarina sp.]
MTTKDYIKVHNPATEVAVHDSENLITLDPGVSVTLEFTDTEKYSDEEIKNIQWIANMFHNSPKNSSFHKTLKGPKAKFRVPTVYSGGGLGWVEPVLPGHDPQFKPPFGYFINSIGERKIDKVEWTDIHGKKINGSKFFTEAVQLHIYTTGLYGHEIKVWLKDTKYFDYNLDLDEDVNNPNDTLAQYFSREVKVLQDTGDNTSKVQKVVIDVRLEKRWEYAGNTLNIIPIIEFNVEGKKKTAFENNAITVETPTEKEAKQVNPATKSGNKPTIIGDIITDVAEFHPCKIKKVTADYFKGSSTQNTDGGQDNTTLEIFDEATSSKAEVIEIDVVAGPRVARREIVFKVEKETEDCVFLGKEKDHNKTIVSVNAPIIIDSKIEPKKYRWDDSFVTNDLGKWFGFGTSYNKGKFEKEDLNHKDQNDNRVLEDSHTTSTSGAFQSVIGFKREHQEAHEVTVKTYTDVIDDDSNFTIEVPYVYGSDATNEKLGDIIKCFFPLKAPKQVYPVKFESCRGEKTVNINVYPDVKWTLQLAYNTDPDEFNKVREKYKDYKVRKEGLKVEKDKLDMEEAVSEDLIEKYEKLADKVKANKGTSKEKQKKKAQKKRYKELANENREKLKEVKEKKKKRKAQKRTLKEDRKNGTVTKKNPKFYNFDNDPDSSYSDLVLSLWAEWDEYGEMFEVTGSYQKYANMVRQFLAVKDFVESIFGGSAKKRGKAKKRGDKRKQQHEESDTAQDIARITKALGGRSIFSMNIIPPSLAIGASWYGEIPKGSPQDGLGIMIESYVTADPIFGVEMVADFLGLLQKVPWFRPIITIMDLVDNIDVTAELSVTGKLHAQGMLQYNSASGETNFHPGQLEPDAEDDSPFKIGGTVELALALGIVLKAEYAMYGVGSVTGAFEASAEMASGITIEGILEATKVDGFYMIPKMTFHGVKVKLLVKGELTIEDDQGTELFSKPKKIVDEELVLLDEYENVWQNDKGEDLKWDLF